MKKLHIFVLSVVLASIASQSLAALRPGEGVIRSPITGDYTATYWDEDETGGELVDAVLITATKFAPKLNSFIKLEGNWHTRYAYKIHNGRKSQQAIDEFNLFGLPANASIDNTEVIPQTSGDPKYRIELFRSALSKPNANWETVGARIYGDELRIGWYHINKNYDIHLGIQPGSSLGGFGFTSADLPGVGVAQLIGNTEWDQFRPKGEMDSSFDIGQQMTQIEENDFVPANIAAPLISVPTPFDPAIVLDNLRTHVATWPSKQLADATIAAQLDAEMVAVANAYRANQPQVARDHIEILLDMIHREHKDIDRDDDDEHDNKRAEKDPDRKATTQAIRLDRLAARVLDFDLKYVLKRMKKDDEHEHERERKNK